MKTYESEYWAARFDREARTDKRRTFAACLVLVVYVALVALKIGGAA